MRRYCLARYTSPIGGMLLASEGAALVGAWFEGQRHFAAHLDEPACTWAESAPIAAARAWLAAYFGGRAPAPELLPPLAPMGTPFQQAVWGALQCIPYGSTTTYGSIAATLRQSGMAAAAQAVGGAVGRNPISIIIPCHRVLGAGGSLTGYAAGVEKKLHLLRLENRGWRIGD